VLRQSAAVAHSTLPSSSAPPVYPGSDPGGEAPSWGVREWSLVDRQDLLGCIREEGHLKGETAMAKLIRSVRALLACPPRQRRGAGRCQRCLSIILPLQVFDHQFDHQICEFLRMQKSRKLENGSND